MLERLRQDPKVKYIEHNGRVHEDSETIPANIQKGLHAGRLPLDLTPSAGLKFDCSDPDSFRIAVVDGGVDVSHYDFEFCGIFDQNGEVDPNREQHCMGKAFLKSSDASDGQDWYNTKRDHGMHVAGIVAASGLNDAGVLGMISDEKICLVIAVSVERGYAPSDCNFGRKLTTSPLTASVWGRWRSNGSQGSRGNHLGGRYWFQSNQHVTGYKYCICSGDRCHSICPRQRSVQCSKGSMYYNFLLVTQLLVSLKL